MAEILKTPGRYFIYDLDTMYLCKQDIVEMPPKPSLTAFGTFDFIPDRNNERVLLSDTDQPDNVTPKHGKHTVSHTALEMERNVNLTAYTPELSDYQYHKEGDYVFKK